MINATECLVNLIELKEMLTNRRPEKIVVPPWFHYKILQENARTLMPVVKKPCRGSEFCGIPYSVGNKLEVI